MADEPEVLGSHTVICIYIYILDLLGVEFALLTNEVAGQRPPVAKEMGLFSTDFLGPANQQTIQTMAFLGTTVPVNLSIIIYIYIYMLTNFLSHTAA